MREKLLKISNYFFELNFKKVIKKIAKEKGFLILENENDIINWGKYQSDYFDNANKLMGSLQLDKKTMNELKTIDYYCGYASENINDYLRGKPINSGNLDSTIEQIKTIDKLINKFKIKDNIIVVRRMSNKFLTRDYKKNGKFIEKGFLSTSLNINYRLNTESDFELLNNESLLLFKIPKGLNGVYVENSIPKERRRAEFEIILNRDYLMKVESKLSIFNNNIIVIKAQTKNVA